MHYHLLKILDKMKKSILNEEQTRVRIFQSMIEVDKSLPKYKTIEEYQNQNDSKKGKTGDTLSSFNWNTSPDYGLREISYNELKKYFSEKFNGIADFNVSLSETMRNNLRQISGSDSFILAAGTQNLPQKETVISVLKKFFKKKKEEKQEKEIEKKFDVIRFFSNVKLSAKEEADKYKDRLDEYISCIGYAEKSGQKALKTKLFQNLVINKYESILYAKGFYKVLSEENLVKFAKDCPKALSLDYIGNYVRTIPLDVITKKISIDELEIFDNYVILHYDPEDDGTEQTEEEKAKEAAKKRDPILFGLIAGSNKLYYIADWEDEYCDLKFQDVVEALGQEIIEKDYLDEKIKG